MENDESKPLLIGDESYKRISIKNPVHCGTSVAGVSTLYYSSDMRFGSKARSLDSGADRPTPQPALVLNQMTLPQPDSGSDLSSLDASSSGPLSHCHVKHHDVQHAQNHKARRTLIMASALCLVFMLAEVVGGYLAGSLAIMTDAAHLLTDFASFLISLFSLFVASRPATRRMSFGWHRAEVLGALLSVIMIWIITVVLVYLAVERIVNKAYEINATYMLITAAVGVFVNVLMGILLHQGGHQHGHSHGVSAQNKTTVVTNDHASRSNSNEWLIDDTVEVIRPTNAATNINIRAAFIHVLGDFFQSIGVLIAAYVIYYHPELTIIDPICTFVFSAVVLLTTVAIMRDALNVLMEGSPKFVDFGEVAESLGSIQGVLRVHNLRIWSLTMDKTALSVHLAIDDATDSQQVLRMAVSMLRKRFNIFECTVQIEHYSDDMDQCDKCEHPKT